MSVSERLDLEEVDVGPVVRESSRTCRQFTGQPGVRGIRSGFTYTEKVHGVDRTRLRSK